MWAAQGDNRRARAVIEKCQGRVSEVKLGETVMVFECHMERMVFTLLGTRRGAEGPIHLICYKYASESQGKTRS